MWEDKDETCPQCGNVTKRAKGINKQNLKRLFSMPSMNDFIILAILILALLTSYAYKRDIAICHNYIAEQEINLMNDSYEWKDMNETKLNLTIFPNDG